MKLITHPDNVARLKAALEKQGLEVHFAGPGQAAPLLTIGVEIITDRHMPKTEWSGRYRLPDGRLAESSKVRVTIGFVEWGNSDFDIKFLLDEGIISKDMEMVFYLLGPNRFQVPLLLKPEDRYA